jgi:hypothetical protein
MLFRKIHFPGTPGDPEPHANWYLVLRNEEELMKYLDVDAWYYAQAFISPNVETYNEDHPAKLRKATVETLLEMTKNSTKVGQFTYPHEVYATHLNKKGMAMLKHLQYGPIQVNEAGGYCNHESFFRTWPTAKVVKEVEQENFAYPEKDRGKVAGQKFGF